MLKNFVKFTFLSLILISSNSLMSSIFGYVNIKDTVGRNWFFRAKNINCKVYLGSDMNNLFCDAAAIVTDISGKKNTKTFYDHPCHNILWGYSDDVICTAAKRLNKFQDFENQAAIIQEEIRENEERKKIAEKEAKEKKIKEEAEFQLYVDEIKKEFR